MKVLSIGAGIAALLLGTACGGGGEPKSPVRTGNAQVLDGALESYDWGAHLDLAKMRTAAPYKMLAEWVKTDPEAASMREFEALCGKPMTEFFDDLAVMVKDDRFLLLARTSVSEEATRECVTKVIDREKVQKKMVGTPAFEIAGGVLRAGDPEFVQASLRGARATATKLELDGDRVVAFHAENLYLKAIDFHGSAGKERIALEALLAANDPEEAKRAAAAIASSGTSFVNDDRFKFESDAVGSNVKIAGTFTGDEAAQVAFLKKVATLVKRVVK